LLEKSASKSSAPLTVYVEITECSVEVKRKFKRQIYSNQNIFSFDTDSHAEQKVESFAANLRAARWAAVIYKADLEVLIYTTLTISSNLVV
jgi:hypothetical protein